MPIGSIITQPNEDTPVAAYRPIILRISATATDSSPLPPVVYCDIYFNNVFYKTISKSQYDLLNAANSEWEFDIQDAAQEYLGKFLGNNGGLDILIATPLVLLAKCKFRSSGLDTEGFIQPEGTIPVQGTGDTNPVDGDGTESVEFFIVNSTLQHEDSQDFITHLSAYKLNGTWDSATYPLTHRPKNYKLCVVDSDYFPILSDKVPSRLRITYIPKGGGDPVISDGEVACIPVTFPVPTLPNASVGDAYSYIIPLSGTAPFSFLGSPVKPAWMDISIDGSNLVFSGTPEVGDIGTHIQISVSIQNCSGDDTSNFTKFIDVSTCVAVSFTDFTFPDARVGSPYNFTVPLSGTAPFVISGSPTKPSWMNIAISGSNLVFTGTPASGDIGSGIAVQLTLSNCGGSDTGDINKTMNVVQSENYLLSASYNLSIDSVTGTGVPALGSTGVNGLKRGHQSGMSGSYSVDISGTPVLLTTHLDVYVGFGLVATIPIPAAGTYSVDVTALESDIVKFYINS